MVGGSNFFALPLIFVAVGALLFTQLRDPRLGRFPLSERDQTEKMKRMNRKQVGGRYTQPGGIGPRLLTFVVAAFSAQAARTFGLPLCRGLSRGLCSYACVLAYLQSAPLHAGLYASGCMWACWRSCSSLSRLVCSLCVRACVCVCASVCMLRQLCL